MGSLRRLLTPQAIGSSQKIMILLSLVLIVIVVPMIAPAEELAIAASIPGSEKNRDTGGLLTVGEIKRTMRLPCNYVHDGFYLKDPNECLNQVYQVLQQLDDDDIPVLIEVGGHDGITKSISLKSSICLNVNTLLIEGSPTNYNIIRQTRAYYYDDVVNAALCNGESVLMTNNPTNTGQNMVARSAGKNTVQVRCTSLDAELDALVPENQRHRLKIVHMILDFEGHEVHAI
jgi:hypothetical protein